MNRKLISACLFLQALCLPLSAQTVLTYSANGMKEGDKVMLKALSEIILPGGEGANQVWDYSRVPVSETTTTIDYNTGFFGSAATGNPFACEQGGGRTSYYDITPSAKLYKGLSEVGGTIEFDQPIKELVFPFRYGSGITGKLTGVYTSAFSGEKEYLNGDYSVVADAWGTLILPNGVKLTDVLRVKYVKDYQQIRSGTPFYITVTHYLYYSSASRYPVLQIRNAEVKCDCGCARTEYFACFDATVKPNTNIALPNTGAPALASVVSYTIYPNPFRTELKFDYALSKKSDLTITLFDLAGKPVKTLLQASQNEGVYSLSENLSYLPSGAYILKITADGQSFSEKVVKE